MHRDYHLKMIGSLWPCEDQSLEELGKEIEGQRSFPLRKALASSCQAPV